MALSTALIAPVAFAQKVKTEIKTTGNPTSQSATQAPRPTLPAQASPRAAAAVSDVTQPRPAPKSADAQDWKDAKSATAPEAMPPGNKAMPTTAQGAAHAAAHSAVVTRDLWTRLDADADGRISATEADLDTGFDADFAGMDADADGFVSDAEYRAFAKGDASQGAAHAAAHSAVVTRDLWTRLDANADGRISATEADLDTGFDADFASMDADADGFVSDAEYRAFAKRDVAQGAVNAAAHASVVQRATWTRLDADADGRVSSTEADADAGFDASFAAMDANNDGFITDAEFRAHAKATSKP
jgi:hypothetical protein